MYEFNPLTSMELLQNLRQDNRSRPAADTSCADAQRAASAARSTSFGEFVRRMIHRIAPTPSRRRAA